MQCKDCIHQQMCKYAAAAEKLKEQLPKTEYPFEVSVRCTHYQQAKGLTRDFYDKLNQYAQDTTGPFYK
jgi:hypothetical protein